MSVRDCKRERPMPMGNPAQLHAMHMQIKRRRLDVFAPASAGCQENSRPPLLNANAKRSAQDMAGAGCAPTKRMRCMSERDAPKFSQRQFEMFQRQKDGECAAARRELQTVIGQAEQMQRQLTAEKAEKDAQLQKLSQDSTILKRAVAIQHNQCKEKDQKISVLSLAMQKLREQLAQAQQTNYTLRAHIAAHMTAPFGSHQFGPPPSPGIC